ncbi:MAG: leucine-rich repeat domain-containing protein [Kiritimatiellia bacterium]
MLIGSRLSMTGGGAAAKTRRYAEYYLRIADGTIKEICDEDTTIIGDYVFQYLNKLARVDFTNCTTIGKYSFSECTSLASVDFPNCTSINQSSFSGCTSLVNVNIPKIYSVGNRSFIGCTRLASVDFPNVTYTNIYAFSGCTGLTRVNMPKLWDISENSFRNCTKLNLLRMDGISEVTTLSNTNAFYNTPSTMRIVVPDALVDAMRAAPKWSDYADRIVGVTEYDAANGGAR